MPTTTKTTEPTIMPVMGSPIKLLINDINKLFSEKLMIYLKRGEKKIIDLI